MNRIPAIICLILLVGLLGCNDDDDSSQAHARWRADFLIANATAPVAAPNSSSFLFIRSGEGLFVWQNGTEQRVSPPGIAVRSDYSWSISGEPSFAYSVPGEPSESSGVFLVDTSGEITQIWDRGSSPSLNLAANYLLCAGPTESETESGIWKINLLTLERDRLSPEGITPRLCNSGQVVTYLVPQATSNGSILTSRRMSDLELLREISHVSQFQAALSSDELLIEIIASLDGLPIPPAIYETSVSESAPLELIAQPAVKMLLLDDGTVLFNRLTGDSLGSLVMREGDAETVVSDSLYSASGYSRDNIYAVGPLGISRLSWR